MEYVHQERGERRDCRPGHEREAITNPLFDADDEPAEVDVGGEQHTEDARDRKADAALAAAEKRQGGGPLGAA